MLKAEEGRYEVSVQKKVEDVGCLSPDKKEKHKKAVKVRADL